MPVNSQDRARGAHTGLRGMREAMRESADVLKSAAAAHDDQGDVDLPRAHRIQDLQADVFRLMEARQEAVRHGDENFYRVLDLQDVVRDLQVEVRDLQIEVRDIQFEVRDRDVKIDSLTCEVGAGHTREAGQQARHEAIARARDAELAQWQAYAAGLRGVVKDMLSSDSWKLTWVMRAVSATLRRRRSTDPALPNAPTSTGIGHDDG